MPFISEAASAIKSRFGFHDRSAAPEPVAAVPSTPDLLKSVTRENFSTSQSLVPASAIRSISEWDDDAAGGNNGSMAPPPVQSFEFCEDPSFWKDHNVQVLIRLRPLSSSEISLQGYSKCVRQESCQTITWTGHPESRFTFDLVADESVSQEKLFKVAGVPMVENCVGGYNSCMFAYGQTGSGKTHTMLGDIEGGTRRHSVNCGMTPRVFEYLFSRIQKEKEARKDEKMKFNCKCSFLEIYNEQILDLLDPSSNNLQIREDVKKGVYVENLKEVEVTSPREVIQQLIQGSANRKVAATNMNRASSRSHSVFTCVVESKWESQGVTHHRFARLNLVDLAGSERQKTSGAEGERLKEATNINKSLSSLGLVIMNLVSISNGKSLHVPYRDSKLTFLLQDSLGGNSKTIIIANISPSLSCSLETLSTLKFAQRAKFIKNNAIVNEDASGDVIAMRIQIQQLKKEVSRLRGLVNGGAEYGDTDTSMVSLLASPGPFKWEGLHGSVSPLMSEKRMSQKKDYEVALVGAFKREKEKEITLKALAAELQAAMQLAKQRGDEIQGLKMRLGFREAGIKRLETVASGKISAEAHLLKEKEEHLKEIEVLRGQVDRNQEVTRFAMENLRLKEEIRRLKSFYEEGEREMMNEQITVLEDKLLEALDWKLMHESDSFVIQKTSSDVEKQVYGDPLISGQEPAWDTSIKEENEFLRMQAIHNQAEIEALNKQLDYSLQEKFKLERDINDLVLKVEEERSSRAARESTQQIHLPHLSIDALNYNDNDQTEIKTMVDAIAAASHREAEAHEKAIVLSKENAALQIRLEKLLEVNDELESKLKALIEEKDSLIKIYEERAVSEIKYKNLIMAESAEQTLKEFKDDGAEAKEMEIKTTVENLEQQLSEMHEENEKLMSLYEQAMRERDEFKRKLSCSAQDRVESRCELDCPEKLVEVDGGQSLESFEPHIDANAECVSGETDNSACSMEDRRESPMLVGCSDSEQDASGVGLQELAQQNIVDCDMEENLIDPLVTAFPRSLGSPKHADTCGQILEISASESHTKASSNMDSRNISDLNLVHSKLETAQEKLSDSAKYISLLGLLEKAVVDFDNLNRGITAAEELCQVKQEELRSLQMLSSEMQERKDLIDKKLSALKYSLLSFTTSVAYFEQREARARTRVHASSSNLEKKKEELSYLQGCKCELEAAMGRIQQSEVESRNNLLSLKTKLEELNQKQENEKVLFSIENTEKVDTSQQRNWNFGSKATELLKSEEEKTKLQTEMKQCREKLGVIRKELEHLSDKLGKTETEMKSVEMDVEKGLKSVEEMEHSLQGIIQEKESLLEMREKGNSEIQDLIIEYGQHVFDADLKEAEMNIFEEELQLELQKMEESRTVRAAVAEKISTVLEDTSCNSCLLSKKMEEELHSVRVSILEAKALFGGGQFEPHLKSFV